MDDENSRVKVACFLRGNGLHVVQYHPIEASPWPPPNPGLTRIGSSIAAASIQPARPKLVADSRPFYAFEPLGVLPCKNVKFVP